MRSASQRLKQVLEPKWLEPKWLWYGKSTTPKQLTHKVKTKWNNKKQSMDVDVLVRCRFREHTTLLQPSRAYFLRQRNNMLASRNDQRVQGRPKYLFDIFSTHARKLAPPWRISRIAATLTRKRKAVRTSNYTNTYIHMIILCGRRERGDVLLHDVLPSTPNKVFNS